MRAVPLSFRAHFASAAAPIPGSTDLEGVRFLQHVEEELRLEDGGGLGRVRGQGHEAAVLVAGAQVLLEDPRQVLQRGGEQRQRAGAVQDQVSCGERRAGHARERGRRPGLSTLRAAAAHLCPAAAAPGRSPAAQPPPPPPPPSARRGPTRDTEQSGAERSGAQPCPAHLDPRSQPLHGPAHFRVTTETRRTTAARAPPLTSGCHGARPSVPLPPGGARAPRPAAVPAARGGPGRTAVGRGGPRRRPAALPVSGGGTKGRRAAARRAQGPREAGAAAPPARHRHGTERCGTARHGTGRAERGAAAGGSPNPAVRGRGRAGAGGAADARGGRRCLAEGVSRGTVRRAGRPPPPPSRPAGCPCGLSGRRAGCLSTATASFRRGSACVRVRVRASPVLPGASESREPGECAAPPA